MIDPKSPTKMTRKLAKDIVDAAEKGMIVVANFAEIDLEPNTRASFDDMGLKVTFRFKIRANANGDSAAKVEFDRCAGSMGIKRSAYGQVCGDMRVIGLNPRARVNVLKLCSVANPAHKYNGSYSFARKHGLMVGQPDLKGGE